MIRLSSALGGGTIFFDPSLRGPITFTPRAELAAIQSWLIAYSSTLWSVANIFRVVGTVEVGMAMPLFADPANLTPTEIEDGPEGETSLQLLQNVYRNRKQPLNVRVRCAVEALVHEYPRVSAVAVTSMSGQSFAEALERAIQRSKSPLALNAPASTIDHDPAQHPPTVSAEEMKRPLSRYRRY